MPSVRGQTYTTMTTTRVGADLHWNHWCQLVKARIHNYIPRHKPAHSAPGNPPICHVCVALGGGGGGVGGVFHPHRPSPMPPVSTYTTDQARITAKRRGARLWEPGCDLPAFGTLGFPGLSRRRLPTPLLCTRCAVRSLGVHAAPTHSPILAYCILEPLQVIFQRICPLSKARWAGSAIDCVGVGMGWQVGELFPFPLPAFLFGYHFPATF
jgi:hypothetical protein